MSLTLKTFSVYRCATAVLLLTTPSLGLAQPPAPPTGSAPATAETLPVRRVVLYKSGVGFFEHVGQVRGDQVVSIELTSGQLDDVLKSLTTLDLGNGRVTGITFNSTAPLEQRLRTLGLPLGGTTTPGQLLNALRGARVEVQGAGAAVVGRVLSLQERQRTVDGASEPVQDLTIVTDTGLVRTFTLGAGVGVRLVEADTRGKLRQYLDLLGSTRGEDVRRLRIATAGTGTRDLLVSYVSEVPVWKSTYRLVIPAAGGRSPFLQGWAIVDNTLGEDWTDVSLSLVAGAPQSFVQQVSQPLYTRRPVVPLPRTAMLTPQAHDGALDSFDKTDGPAAGIPGGALGGVVGGLPSAPPPPAPRATGSRVAENGGMAEEVVERVAASRVAARGQELGDLFQYTLTEPITVRRNQSALVPIVQADVAIERVSLWNAGSSTGRPWRAVWLTNDTGLTLDGGSVSLVEAGAFAGEGLLEPIQPKARRLISYAMDLAARVSVTHDGGPRRVSRITIARGAFVQVVQERVTHTYTARNDDATARTFVIEQPRRDGWSLATGAPAPAEATADTHRFRLAVAPRTTQTLAVEEVREVESRLAVSTITSDQVTLILRGRNVDAAVEPQLRALMAQNAEVTRLQSAVRERRAEIERIEKDQARVRENLTALKTSAEERQLVARYAAQLNTQEDRLVVLRREVEDLELQRGKAQEELVRLANALTLDVTMP